MLAILRKCNSNLFETKIQEYKEMKSILLDFVKYVKNLVLKTFILNNFFKKT